MFTTIEPAPPDPILGLSEAFKADPNPKKINLGVGIYKDEHGRTPVLACVAEAERRLLEAGSSKSYLPIDGDPAYDMAVQALMFGAGSELAESLRCRTCQTPGGTGALRVAADYLHACHRDATVWLPDPTWANHGAIFQAAGVSTGKYAYFDAKANAVDARAMLGALREIPTGDVVLLHGCCHNPSGADPSDDLWRQIAPALAKGRLLPLVDFAYQGFADGLEEDATGLRTIAGQCDELLVCSSFSKNFSLYNERVGALTIVAADQGGAEAVLSNVKVAVRRNYSNPPAHGAQIVRAILADAALTEQWHGELAQMRNRINDMRKLFADTLSKLTGRDFGFIKQQRGMFSFSGLTKDQVQRLRAEQSIYIVGSGRVNVAGMTSDNLDRLCDAIAKVL